MRNTAETAPIFWANPAPVEHIGKIDPVQAREWIRTAPKRAGIVLGFHLGQDAYPLADGVEPVTAFVSSVAQTVDPQLEEFQKGIELGQKLAILKLKGDRLRPTLYRKLDYRWALLKSASKAHSSLKAGL